MPRATPFAPALLIFLSIAAGGFTGPIPAAGAPGASPDQSSKPPRPKAMGQGAALQRDTTSGELKFSSKDAPGNAVDSAAKETIRSNVTLVQVPCTVVAPDGTQVRGLAQDNFHLFEDGVPQEIASFDASATSASIALVMDSSPSIYHELEGTRDAAHAMAANLSPSDEIAVVSFSAQAHLLLPFSTNRELLDRVIDSKYLAKVENSSESQIYQSLYLTAHELFYGRQGRKAIVLLTDGQDSGLGLSWDPRSAQPRSAADARLAFDDVARELGADGIALFIVSTENRPRAMTPEWLEGHQDKMMVSQESRSLNMPNYTLYLAELARRVGGQLYFLKETGNLTEIYRRIALAISA
ncbi:MAG: VWA domain-containing protein, partial [Bryobacteraceae bacterium]